MFVDGPEVTRETVGLDGRLRKQRARPPIHRGALPHDTERSDSPARFEPGDSSWLSRVGGGGRNRARDTARCCVTTAPCWEPWPALAGGGMKQRGKR